MSDKATEAALRERIALISTAARIPLAPDSRERIARAVTATVTRFAAASVVLPFEVEPSSFTVVAHEEIRE